MVRRQGPSSVQGSRQSGGRAGQTVTLVTQAGGKTAPPVRIVRKAANSSRLRFSRAQAGG